MTPAGAGDKGQLARRYFEEGYSCSQAVLLAFAPECGLERDEALRLASSFGGGFGRQRELCGAMAAVGMVAGLLCGYDDPSDQEAKARHYRLIQDLSGKFRERWGSLRCGELLAALRLSQGPEPTPRTPEFYRVRPCGELVACAASILAGGLGPFSGPTRRSAP